MKKICLILFILISTIVFCGYWDDQEWTIITVTDSTTLLKECPSGQRLVLVEVSMTVQNACNMYICDEDGTQLWNTWYRAANSGLSFIGDEAINVPTDTDKDLYIWASADPGADIAFRYNVVSD